MEEHKVPVRAIENLTHDVKRLTIDKPTGYHFTPGQATEVALDQDGWREEGRPFTFTSLPDEDQLELVVKCYRDHKGVTQKIDKLNIGDHLLLHDVWGAIHYTKPGVFIAGGAGVTPFIAIFRQLKAQGKADGNKLLFFNHTQQDVIMRSFWEQTLGDNFHSFHTHEGDDRIHAALLKKYAQAGDHFYLCGPDGFVEAAQEAIQAIGGRTEAITLEA